MHKNRCSFLGKSWFHIMSALSSSLLSLVFPLWRISFTDDWTWDGWEVVLGEAHWIMLSVRVGACSLKVWLIGSLISHHCLSVKFQQWRSALISQNMPCILCLCVVIHSNPSPFCLEFAFSPCPLVNTLILLFKLWLRCWFFPQDISLASPDIISLLLQYFCLCTLCY